MAGKEPIARVTLGPGHGQGVSIRAFTASEAGIPTVELAGDLTGLHMMKPETAVALANGLLVAATAAQERP